RPRVQLPPGYVSMTCNGGSLHKKGYEASINVIPFRNEQQTWSTTMNGQKNTSKTLKFACSTQTIKYTNAQRNAGPAAKTLDEHVLRIVGRDYQRSEEEYVIIDDNGYRLIDSEEKSNGNREPEFSIGWLNRLRYKGFDLSFMWDFRFGGDILNASRQGMMSRSEEHTSE